MRRSTHAAERKVFESVLDPIIKKSQTQDIGDVINSFVVLVQKIHGSVWTPETLRISIDNLKSPVGTIFPLDFYKYFCVRKQKPPKPNGFGENWSC